MTEKEKRKNPLYLMREIEAFCCFQFGAGISADDVQKIKTSIQDCLDSNCEVVMNDNGYGHKWKDWKIAGIDD